MRLCRADSLEKIIELPSVYVCVYVCVRVYVCVLVCMYLFPFTVKASPD